MNNMDQYSELLPAGMTKTLADNRSEVNAKIYLKAKDNLRLVNVDHALIGDKEKKCDFMAVGENSDKTHMIELKGADIEAAFRQITSTINVFLHDDELKKYVIAREVLDAYIASPERQRVPNIPSLKEREAVRKLAAGNKRKPENIFDLLHFVKVVKNQKKVIGNGRQLIISGRAPLELD